MKDLEGSYSVGISASFKRDIETETLMHVTLGELQFLRECIHATVLRARVIRRELPSMYTDAQYKVVKAPAYTMLLRIRKLMRGEI